jgi:NADPH:quinone reductase-like Zn-dependent oxidoreductase
MRGIYVGAFGDVEVMKRRDDLPEPSAGPGQVLVRVGASGINFAETRMRAGTYSGVNAPFVLGMESAGEVMALGAGVSGFEVGQRVFGRARGSHAEQVVFDARHLMPLPTRLSFEQGAAIPVGWLTAWHALITVADVKPGQRVLIEAIGSSVGSAALQVARWRGCWVGGTASTTAKASRAVSEFGADAAYVYKSQDVAGRVREDTSGHGADVALMTIGQETAESTFNAMAMDGKVVMYGSTGGRQICFDLGIGSRNLQLLSMSISTSAAFLSRTMPDFRARALPLFADGTFVPLVDCVLPLDQVAEAHRMIDARRHFGKIVLQVPQVT